MKKFLLLTLLFLHYTSCQFAQDIADISSADRSYSSIKNSVNKGYLSLYSDNTFRPDQSLTRKEVAVMLDLILKYVDNNKVNLSSADINDLNRLSTTFRESFLTVETSVNSLNQFSTALDDEQKVLQYELTEQQNKINKLTEQNRYLWIGVGVAALLGIIF